MKHPDALGMEAGTRQRMMILAAWMLAGLAHWCQADVIIISTLTNKTFTAVGDLPALFGPPIPLTGFKGYASYVTPPDACSKVRPPPKSKNITGPWIGIVKRYNCAFVEKVLNTQIAGYDAVIVHNVGSNSIQPMGSDNQSLSEKVNIPSVFIGQDDAFMIIENFLYDKGYILEITDDLPFNLQNYLVPFAITIGICFIVMLTFMVVKCVRDYRRSRRHRLSSRALKKLPVHKFKKGDPYECCAICLEDYVDNDKLRILPCEHAYHAKCIDPWLTKNRRVCPVCKRKVFTGDERPSDLETDSEDENSPLINSEGGTQGGTFDSQRENPFQEAQRLADERRRRRRLRRNVSHNVECGPEGYQRLAESTDDEEGEGEEGEDEEEQREEEKNEVCGDSAQVVSGSPEHAVCEGEVNAPQSSQEPPATVCVIVHDSPRPISIRDSSSLSRNSSLSSHGTPPGPVQIAVDVVNSPASGSSLVPQPSQSYGDAGSERDYVV